MEEIANAELDAELDTIKNESEIRSQIWLD